MIGKFAAFGRDNTRSEMFTICRSFEPVGDEIFLGRDLKLSFSNGGMSYKMVVKPNIVNDGILEPWDPEVETFRVDFLLYPPYSVKHDSAMATID